MEKMNIEIDQYFEIDNGFEIADQNIPAEMHHVDQFLRQDLLDFDFSKLANGIENEGKNNTY